jgi:hypothetical protein
MSEAEMIEGHTFFNPLFDINHKLNRAEAFARLDHWLKALEELNPFIAVSTCSHKFLGTGSL